MSKLFYPVKASVNNSFRDRAFCNLSLAGPEGGIGFQVKTTDLNGEAVQPYFGFREYGSVQVALEAALKERNRLYEKFGYPCFMTYELLPEMEVSNRSSTGYHGVYYKSIYDHRKPALGPAITCAVRNLKTGRASNRSFRIESFGSEESAIKHAVEYRAENISHYNELAESCNDILINECIRPAIRHEVKNLKPQLQDQIGARGQAWLRLRGG